MKNDPPKVPVIFRGMDDKEIKEALSALHSEERRYEKGEIILHAGTVGPRMGLVLEGSVTIESNDVWGNRTILSHVSAGNLFAETYALLGDEPMLVDVTANVDCRILFLKTGSLTDMTANRSGWSSKMIANLLVISSHKNLTLSGRSFHTSPKTVRGRVMSYLNSVSLRKSSSEFDIPFDRQQLADYLNLDRTALSKELGKMQKEGLIRVKKNHFELRPDWENFRDI